MKWRVFIRPRAEEDLRQARQWYEQQRAGLGDELMAAIRLGLRSLQENPASRPLYYREFRRLLTRRFPYKIFYIIERDRVIVFRILHAKQDHPRRLGE